MKEEKMPEVLMHLLINMYAEIHTLKEYMMGDFMLRNDITSKEDNMAFTAQYVEKTKQHQKDIIAQLRARYDDSLGSVDDLLSSLL